LYAKKKFFQTHRRHNQSNFGPRLYWFGGGEEKGIKEKIEFKNKPRPQTQRGLI
jgi:hypothetical protein